MGSQAHPNQVTNEVQGTAAAATDTLWLPVRVRGLDCPPGSEYHLQAHKVKCGCEDCARRQRTSKQRSANQQRGRPYADWMQARGYWRPAYWLKHVGATESTHVLLFQHQGCWSRVCRLVAGGYRWQPYRPLPPQRAQQEQEGQQQQQQPK